MNNYRVDLMKYVPSGVGGYIDIWEHDHMLAETSQEVADEMRKCWPGWYIQRISVVVHDWQ